MGEESVSVVMTASGRVKEYPARADIREVLETVYGEHQRAGSNWDRPAKLFINGECVVSEGLTDIAWEYGRFRERQDDMLEGLLDEWIDRKFNQKADTSSTAAAALAGKEGVCLHSL